MDLGEVLQRPCHTLELFEKKCSLVFEERQLADINSCLIDVNERINFFNVTLLTQVTTPPHK